MTAIIQELLRRSDLPDVMADLEEAMQVERERRQQFLDWVEERQYAEFINGEIIVHSPERWTHGEVVKLLTRLVDAFIEPRGLGTATDNKMVEFPRNNYIPDLCYWPADAVATFTDHTTLFPPPLLAVEVLSESTTANDRGVKFTDYAAHGVQEYWLVDPDDRRIEQYENRHGTFHLRAATMADQKIHCLVLPGLKFPANAAFDAKSNAIAIEQL